MIPIAVEIPHSDLKILSRSETVLRRYALINESPDTVGEVIRFLRTTSIRQNGLRSFLAQALSQWSCLPAQHCLLVTQNNEPESLPISPLKKGSLLTYLIYIGEADQHYFDQPRQVKVLPHRNSEGKKIKGMKLTV